MEEKPNFTQIPNELMEILLSNALSRNEARVLLFIARKTYGFQKESDKISLSQFQNKLNLSRQGMVNILKRLQLVKLCRLVNKGNSRLASSEWMIDTSDYPDKLVKLCGLVKFTPNKLVNIYRHTKESITKESVAGSGKTITHNSLDDPIARRLVEVHGKQVRQNQYGGYEYFGGKNWIRISSLDAFEKSLTVKIPQKPKLAKETFDPFKQGGKQL